MRAEWSFECIVRSSFRRFQKTLQWRLSIFAVRRNGLCPVCVCFVSKRCFVDSELYSGELQVSGVDQVGIPTCAIHHEVVSQYNHG
jgi:hypothetical protein